jgi:hypothetical protein
VDAIRSVNQENICRALATFKPKKVGQLRPQHHPYCDCRPKPGKVLMQDVSIFASDSPVSVDAAFLQAVDCKLLNDHVDCMLQVREAKVLGSEGDLKAQLRVLT